MKLEIGTKSFYIAITLVVVAILLLAGCTKRDTSANAAPDGTNTTNATSTTSNQGSYTQITQEEAAKMMEENEDVIILDVRTREEYSAGHIPNAICVPNEEIVDAQPAELADLDQVILVYCRSGNRSKQASQKLTDMGYRNIYEFGGIIDWTGDIVTE